MEKFLASGAGGSDEKTTEQRIQDEIAGNDVLVSYHKFVTTLNQLSFVIQGTTDVFMEEKVKLIFPNNTLIVQTRLNL